jgi:hypothetical protein
MIPFARPEAAIERRTCQPEAACRRKDAPDPPARGESHRLLFMDLNLAFTNPM